MGYKRDWDTSCPRMWDSWDGKDGFKWVIRDLRPEDDETALNILVENMCRDETLFVLNDIVNDAVSMECLKGFWRNSLAQRWSLGCYQEKDGSSKLVGLNVCVVECEGDELTHAIEGKALTNVFHAVLMCDTKVDAFKLLDTDKLLIAFGLVVHRDYRGLKLGPRILTAREPLALHHGIKGTSTVFTSLAGQICAERAGFTTVATVTMKELAEAGLDYPDDETKCLKLMIKKYV